MNYQENKKKHWFDQLIKAPLHAYFIAGENTQKDIEKAVSLLLCEKNGLIPCGVCQSCLWYQAKSHPDFHHIQSDENRAVPIIRLDQIKQLQEELYHQPQKRYRVIWIEDAHTMRHEAQNALLKALEEPPTNVVFLLSGQINGMLPTVRSRCSIIRLQDGKETAFDQEKIDQAGKVILLLMRGGERLAQKQLAEQKQLMSAWIDIMILLLRELVAKIYDLPPLDESLRSWVNMHRIDWDVQRINDLLVRCLQTNKRLRSNANVGLCADWLCIYAERLRRKFES